MSADEQHPPLPGWLAGAGFVASPSDGDESWESLAEHLAVDALFLSAVELAATVLAGPDPWAEAVVPRTTLTDAQRARLSDE